MSMFQYIETVYKLERPHQGLGYKCPDYFRAEYPKVLALEKLTPPLSESDG